MLSKKRFDNSYCMCYNVNWVIIFLFGGLAVKQSEQTIKDYSKTDENIPECIYGPPSRTYTDNTENETLLFFNGKSYKNQTSTFSERKRKSTLLDMLNKLFERK